MKSLTFDYQKSCGIDQEEISHHSKKLLPEIQAIKKKIAQQYATEYASLYLPYDYLTTHALGSSASLQDTISRMKALHPSMLVVIGIGGSNLGTMAVQQALFGNFYNAHEVNLKIYYADTVDSDYIWDILLLMEQKLQEEETVIVNVVSKSGTTLESVANFALFVQMLKSYLGDGYHNYIMVTTDKGSALANVAHENKYALAEIPANVGGRYSVLSPVGLFPLALIGVDTAAMLHGARDIIEQSLREAVTENDPALSAIIIYAHYLRAIAIHNLFIFSVDLASMGAWYRQLMGESIGKEKDRSGNTVHVGITPLVSIGSTDLHSVGQLYLSGRRDMLTTFVTVRNNKSQCVVPEIAELSNLTELANNKDEATLMNAIIQGTQQAYRDRELPFTTVSLADKSAFTIGQFLQFKMCEMIYLGFLLNINPFDQPNVEAYKTNTRKILMHE